MKKTFTAIGGLLIVLLLTALLWPLPEQVLVPSGQPPQQILDRNGKLLYEVRHPDFGSQEQMEFESIPKKVIDALISTEDRRFYSHWGVSPRSIVRALWQNYQAGKVVSGGSTITQQLVRNRLQPPKRDYSYKLYEMFVALKLETHLSKEDILESYLNSAYFGQQAYGIQAASKTYFNKSVIELSLAESAFLIGLVQSPSGYNPFRHFESAKKRQAFVLESMKATNSISTREVEEALEEPLNLVRQKVGIKAPHFVFWVLEQIEGEDGPPPSLRSSSPLKGGLHPRLLTTLDLDMQTEIEHIVTNELTKLEEQNVTSAAVVVLDVHTGEILSMLGSADYFDDEHDGQVNVAVASRQPGSALKPFTYALALAQGGTAATTVADIEAQFFTQEGNPYIPRNYDYGFHGLVRYREALANSYNIPAVKVAEKVGIPRLLEFLQKAGLSTLTNRPEFYGVALTLGSGEVRLLELTQAYGIFPRGGRTLPVQFLLNDVSGAPSGLSLTLSTLEREPPSASPLPPPAPENILDPKIAWLISDILSDNQARIPEFGEDSALSFPFPVGAKTGTTRNSRDNWTIGFSADHLVGVWVGNADNSPMLNTSGITGAGPIFHAVMQAVSANRPPKAFSRPDGFVQQEICMLSGKLPTPYCPHTMQEWFVAGTEPRDPDELYQPVLVDTRNDLLANSSCDAQFVEEQVFIDFPPELEKWSRENGYAQAPLEYSPLCSSLVSSSWLLEAENQKPTNQQLVITKPHNGDSFRLDPLIPDEDEKIILEARAADNIETITWLVDGKEVGIASAPDFRLSWQPKVGKHNICISIETGLEIAPLTGVPLRGKNCISESLWIEVEDGGF